MSIIKRAALSAVGFIGVLVAGPSSAITFGQPDGNEHPYVGTLLFVQNGESRSTSSDRTSTRSSVRRSFGEDAHLEGARLPVMTKAHRGSFRRCERACALPTSVCTLPAPF